MKIQQNLSEISDRLSRARQELRIVEEQVVFQGGVVEDAKTRMLVSETPIADREFRAARDDLERLLKQQERALDEIRELEAEQDRLLDRMLGARS